MSYIYYKIFETKLLYYINECSYNRYILHFLKINIYVLTNCNQEPFKYL